MSRQRRTVRLARVAFNATLVLTLALAPPATIAQTSSTAMPAQSTIAGVTVKVTPVSLGEAGGPVEFSVVFDTHSTELTDDLMQSASLTLPDGRKLKPARWTGAGPGGHHREGVLSFDGLDPGPGAVELSITRPGESSPRFFRFQR